MDWDAVKRHWLSVPLSARESLVGFGTSATAIALTYPPETLVRQFHVTDRKEHNTRSLVRQTMREKGFRGFYKGLGPALTTQPAFWAVYTPVYEAMKRQSGRNTFGWNMVHSYVASGVAAAVSNPLWVLRQRMQTEVLKGKRNTYRQLIGELYRENGTRTFFRGLNITLVKNVQMTALMPLFELWKQQSRDGVGVWGHLQTLGLGVGGTVMLSAGVAKIVSSTGVYPLDVLRTNMRVVEGSDVTFRSVSKVVMKRTGGALNLFRGVGWYWVSAASMFGVMQLLKTYMDSLAQQAQTPSSQDVVNDAKRIQ